jgi:FlgD Ig-like domain
MTRRDGRYGTRIAFALLISLLAHAMLASVSEGRPNIRAGFFAAYPSAVGSRLDNLPSITTHCGACHYKFTGAGPRNPFGVTVETALGNFPNTDAGRRDAVLSVQNQDQDTDGFTSVTEITNLANYSNTPTFPGLNATNVSQVSDVDVNDILAYLTPTTATDLTPPVVSVTAPNGAESWTGGQQQSITWTATDNVAVTSVDLFYRDAESEPWTPIAMNVANTGSFTWFVHNTPSAAARVRVAARDAVGNQGSDQSDNLFSILIKSGGIVPTTLRDFHQPGTQPFGAGSFEASTNCTDCHGGYNTAVEPGHNFKGTLMAQAARDPLFFACVAIAEQDAPSSGDLCLRCHTPFGWMSGRSNPTDGTQLTALDRDGVACGFCHRVVDPVYKPGISPVEDQAVLNQLAAGDLPLTYSNGQFVVDPDIRKRGPYLDAGAFHPRLYSPLHTSSDFCGTCHDVSNPVFNRTGSDDYTPGPLDAQATSFASTDLMPLERTYSEWKHSAYPSGVYQPEFAGNKASGIVSTCQDCHMRDVSGQGCNDPGAPVRADLPLHDMTGGNAWIPSIIASLYPGETDAAALNAGAQRAVSMLQKAAGLGVTYAVEADSFRALVTVTNRTGHKLPTGYPEGRRMWLHVVARDELGQKIYESGAYDAATGVLSMAPEPVVYECKLGVSAGLGGAVGVPSGPSFHFTLNDTVVKDNRIPPSGFTNASFATFGGRPVDPHHAGQEPLYVDGQNWHVAEYPLPSNAHSVIVRLLYQTTSKEYVEFLRDENTTNTAGDDLYNLWVANGRGAPVEMERDSIAMTITSVDEGSPITQSRLAVLQNPFDRALDLKLELARPAAVRLRVFDVHGRQVLDRDYGTRSGSHRLTWDGRDQRGETVRAGVYWAVVRAGDNEWRRQIVRIR